MSLDINTPKGKVSLMQEQRLIAALESKFTSCRVYQTPKSLDADIDGLICRGGEVIGVMENKCRDMTSADLMRFGNEWLLTYEKIVKGASIAKILRVPFIGYLYLVPEGKALSVILADSHGNLVPKIRIERTETQATTNGGKATRTNAYVNMDGAKEFEVMA